MSRIWKVALIGGDDREVFRIREGLRALNVQFELTQYADAAEARAAGIERGKLPQVILPDMPRYRGLLPLLLAVSGPVPDGVVLEGIFASS